MNLINLNEKYNQISELVRSIEFKDVRLSEGFTAAYKEFVNTEKPNGYADVEWADFSAKITTTTGKLVFVTNFWFYIAKELSDYLSGLERHKKIFRAVYADADLKEAAERLRAATGGGISYADRERIESYFNRKNFGRTDLDNFISFVADYDSWGGGKTVDRNDFYVSALLKAGNLLAETQSAIAEIARQFSSNLELSGKFEFAFVDKGQNTATIVTGQRVSNYPDNSRLTLPKPFILLAGISGTGKSRFVREQAGAHGQDGNFCLVAVRPDWHEPGDLLGYVSRLSGTNKYVATDVLGFMARAWKSLHSRGLVLDASSGQTTRLSGSASLLDAVAPYWLCLDEMNLAPVEQYFADYLSLIETRHWQHSPDGAFTYSCDALLKGSVLGELEQAAQQELARNLGLGNISPAGEDYGLWQHFLRHGIAIAPNLIVAGTVNMDETTHGFSRKVIDRAMSFDFGEFFPNDFDDYLAGSISHVPLTFARQSSGRDAVAKEAAAPSIEFLKAVNGVLKGSPFELAYRALNELLLAVDCHGSPAPGRELQAVWDDFLMQKLLPRIEGDADKLQDGQDGNANLLTRLRDLLENQLAAIWEQGNTRPDFYRLQDGQPVTTECRSRRKIDWMLKRLERSGFTSFWP